MSTTGDSSGSSPGGKIGARIATHVANAAASVRAQMLPTHAKLGATILDDFFNLVSGEIRGTVGEFYGNLADQPDTPTWAKRTFHFLGRGTGQWQAILGAGVSYSGIGNAIVNLMSNELNPVTGRLIAANPNGYLAPGDAANAVAHNIETAIDYPGEAAAGGLSSERFATLVELQRSILSPQDIQALINRGHITAAQGAKWLERAGFESLAVTGLLDLAHTDLSPAALADFVTFGVLDEGQAAQVAARSGVSAEDFHTMVLGNGQPPSTTDLLFAYRRGIIDKARLLKGIEQGPVRNEWFDVIESLGSVPMSTADAIDAAVQGHISADQAKTIAIQNGLVEQDFQPLYDTAGSPLGPEKMLELLNRGIMSEADVIQGVKESRLKNKYIPWLIASRFPVPPETVVRSMYAKGVIDKSQALSYLQQLGYTPEIAAAMAAEASATKMAKTKDLTASQIAELYKVRGLDHDTAATMLQNLGYDPNEAEWILSISDLQRAQSLQNTAISKIRSGYVGYKQDLTATSTALDQVGVPAAQRDDLIAIWDVERTISTRSLTVAEIRSARKKGIITDQDALDRLLGMGYTQDDAVILLQL